MRGDRDPFFCSSRLRVSWPEGPEGARTFDDRRRRRRRIKRAPSVAFILSLTMDATAPR